MVSHSTLATDHAYILCGTTLCKWHPLTCFINWRFMFPGFCYVLRIITSTNSWCLKSFLFWLISEYKELFVLRMLFLLPVEGFLLKHHNRPEARPKWLGWGGGGERASGRVVHRIFPTPRPRCIRLKHTFRTNLSIDLSFYNLRFVLTWREASPCLGHRFSVFLLHKDVLCNIHKVQTFCSIIVNMQHHWWSLDTQAGVPKYAFTRFSTENGGSLTALPE